MRQTYRKKENKTARKRDRKRKTERQSDGGKERRKIGKKIKKYSTKLICRREQFRIRLRDAFYPFIVTCNGAERRRSEFLLVLTLRYSSYKHSLYSLSFRTAAQSHRLTLNTNDTTDLHHRSTFLFPTKTSPRKSRGRLGPPP